MAIRTFNTVGIHCAGEVCDVVVGGVLDTPPMKTMFEKRQYFEKHRDDLRQILLNEPRGRSAMCHNIILPPCNPKADAGFLIMEHEEYPAMSGANTIATSTVLLETGMVPMKEPRSELTLDTPAGLVTIEADCENGKCKSVEFHNVPAFVYVLDKDIQVAGIGNVRVDIAWGGMFYVLVDAASVGLDLRPEHGAEIVRIGEQIKRAVQEQTNPVHPENPEIHGVTVLQFTMPLEVNEVKGTQNTVIVSPGRIDRSPCGTGTCARLAVLHARGQLAEGELLYNRSIIGTEFIGRVTGTTTVGEYQAVHPAVKGSAWITGFNTVVLHPTDPFPQGFRVGDCWVMD